jgi:hypothetical protein
MIRVVAQSIETSLDDDEGLTSLFIKWGPVGQYIDLARQEDDDKVYCELFDQANGAEFGSIRFSYSNSQLALEVTPPETFVPRQREHTVEIDLSGVHFDDEDLTACLAHLFQGK